MNTINEKFLKAGNHAEFDNSKHCEMNTQLTINRMISVIALYSGSIFLFTAIYTTMHQPEPNSTAGVMLFGFSHWCLAVIALTSKALRS